MTHLERLNDDELHLSTLEAARQDQASTLNTIDHLREIHRRMVHLKRGYSSLQNYAEEALRFSEPAAAERVSAMRLTMAVPEAREKLESRELTLSSAVAVDRFIRREEQVSERKFSPEEKKRIVEEVAGCSVRETKKTLLSFAADPEPHLFREKVRQVTPTRSELTVFVNDHFLGEVERVRELKGALSLEVIFTDALGAYLKQIDLGRKKARGIKVAEEKAVGGRAVGGRAVGSRAVEAMAKDDKTAEVKFAKVKPADDRKTDSSTAAKGSNAKSESHTSVKQIPADLAGDGDLFGQTTRTSESSPRTDTRYVRVSDERRLQSRSGGQCEFVDEKTGRRCPGRYRVQNEHRIAFALGGPTEFWNLRHYCRAHNQLAAIQDFGKKKMQEYVPSLR